MNYFTAAHTFLLERMCAGSHRREVNQQHAVLAMHTVTLSKVWYTCL